MFSGAFPVLVRVTDCAALGTPIDWLPKLIAVLLKLTTGAGHDGRAHVCLDLRGRQGRL